MKMLMAAALISLPIVVNAQTENPRGIYKMTALTGKMGEVKAPFEQYKICTDSVTLMVSERAAFFSISDNDHRVFNYTGDQPKSEGDKSMLIYDSNAKQFKMKWWSTYTNHIHFPNNDWCIEKYESGKYTEMSKIFFAYKFGNKTCQVKWLSKDRIAVEEHIDYRTDWMILERVTDGTTPLSHIASQFISKNR